MSKFIKFGGHIINVDHIESLDDYSITLSSGEKIEGSTYGISDDLTAIGVFIPLHTITYVVQPSCYYEDEEISIPTEEYPIIGWRVTKSLDTSSEAVPVFHEGAGDFESGCDSFERFKYGKYSAFPLAIRFEGSETIWLKGCAMTRAEFIDYCKRFYDDKQSTKTNNKKTTPAKEEK
jgi:hypothetical protein